MQARRVHDVARTTCKLHHCAAFPRGPIEEIRIFVWRNGDWHPLPEDQQRQVKEGLKAGETVFKVLQGTGYWTLDTTARTGWVQIGRTRRRPLKFVEDLSGMVSPHGAFSRGLRMRLPYGPAAKKGFCLVDGIIAEWEAVAGSRETIAFEDFAKAWRGPAGACSSREVVVVESSHHSGQQLPGSKDEGLVRAAVQELWAAANLQPNSTLHRYDWLHLRLLEVQAPSQFALLGLSDAIREKGDPHLHWRLLDLFMIGCQRCKGPDDGLLSRPQLQEALKALGRPLMKRRNSADGKISTAASGDIRRSQTSSSSRPARSSSVPPSLKPEDETRPRKSSQVASESSSGRGARLQPVAKEEAKGWAQRVTRSIGLGRPFSLQEERELLASRRAEEDPAGSQRQLRTFLTKYGEKQLNAFVDGQGEEEDFVTYYDFLNHMLERKKCVVRLHQYDLSAGRAWWLSPVLLCRQMEGIWHTGVVVFDREYWYGGRIFESKVGQTPYGTPTKVITMGEATMRSRQELWHFVQRQLQFQFTVHNYDVLTNNCNHFSDAVCSFLVNEHIPDEVLRQPQVVMRTPVVSLLRAVLNHQLGTFGGDGGPQSGALAQSSRRPSPGQGGSPDVPRSTCTLTAEEEWEQVQEGDLVFYEYEPGWTAVARVDSRDVDACDLHWLDARLGEVHAEEEVPSGAVRLLLGGGMRHDGICRTRLAARHRVSCGLCA